MRPSVAEPRFIDRVDDKSDCPRGIPAQDEEETEPPISELTMSRTWYYAEVLRLLGRDIYDPREGQIFQNRYLAAETFLNELTKSLGSSETIDVKGQLFEWITIID
jgi:hypothetical protein